MSQPKQQFTLKNDRYRKEHGGTARFLSTSLIGATGTGGHSVPARYGEPDMSPVQAVDWHPDASP